MRTTMGLRIREVKIECSNIRICSYSLDEPIIANDRAEGDNLSKLGHSTSCTPLAIALVVADFYRQTYSTARYHALRAYHERDKFIAVSGSYTVYGTDADVPRYCVLVLLVLHVHSVISLEA